MGLGGLLGLLYGAAYLFFVGHTLPARAEIAGVEVGGLTREAAVEKLTKELTPLETRPLQVRTGGVADHVLPSEAGLSFDHVRSVERAGGRRSLDPRQLVRVLGGGAPSAAVVRVDEQRLAAAVNELARRVDRGPVDARVFYDGTEVRRTQSTLGVTLQQPQAARTLIERFASAERSFDLPASLLPPAVDDREAARVVSEVAEPAVSAPIAVRVNSTSIEISPEVIAKSLTFEVNGGVLRPQLAGNRLRRASGPLLRDAGIRKPRDATIRVLEGRPRVVPAVDGTDVTADDLVQAIKPVLSRTGAARSVRAPVSTVVARFSTADAERLGIKEVTGRFTTRFPYLAYRNVNIGRGAELINETLLRPGEVFSLNEIVGERTKANGFTEGYIISGGNFRKELGGGVSQVATTTFNAMFFAGLKDVEHQPHTLYIDRYPPGREATVAWPSLDLKFENDTRYGVLVEARVVKAAPGTQGSITVTMWSTKTYDEIRSTAPSRSDFTTGRDRTDDSPTCEPQEPVAGFKVRYARLFYRDGKIVRREHFSWRYAATDRIRCV